MSETESVFLAKYDIHAFDLPLTTVDSVVFTVHESALKVLLVKRAAHPDLGKWSLPGGFVDIKVHRSLEQCAGDVVTSKTGIIPPYLEQLQTVGGPRRDKRGWSVTILYFALIAHSACQVSSEAVDEARWFTLDKIRSLSIAFDHKQLIRIALERLQQKALYTIVPAYALPKTFTLGELQRIHEIILDKPLQKKSFRRRLEQADLLIETGEMAMKSGGRPAKLYRAKPESKEYTFLRNLEM